jgi:hypothetical protein
MRANSSLIKFCQKKVYLVTMETYFDTEEDGCSRQLFQM